MWLKLSQWGLVDATFPVAQFARDRMAERLGAKKSAADPEKPLLPVSSDDTTAAADDDEEKGGAGGDDDDGSAAAAAAAKKPPEDLLSKFLAARRARPDFVTDRMVLTMAVSMAFAGSDTTSISLSAVFYYLLRHPGALARLRADIDDAARAGVFASSSSSGDDDGLVSWAASQRLPYLDACVKEAWRLHPAAGLPLERVVPAGGVDVATAAGRWHVPAGTIVGCSAWVIHRRPEVWGPDVDAYRPERFLVDDRLAGDERLSAERRVRDMNATLFQFGMGSRTCLGKNISTLEIYKVVPSLLRRFDVSFF